MNSWGSAFLCMCTFGHDMSQLVKMEVIDYRKKCPERPWSGLKATCLKQGLNDSMETVLVQCKNAREALRSGAEGTEYSDSHLAVQSVSVAIGLQRALDKLPEEMHFMRMEMKETYYDKQITRAWNPEKSGPRLHASWGECSSCYGSDCWRELGEFPISKPPWVKSLSLGSCVQSED